MITVYGIPNCNSVKKAIDWLRQNDITYTFHDYKKQGIEMPKLKAWSKALGLTALVNTKGTTWRGLPDDEKAAAAQEQGALDLMSRQTSVIKRPLIEVNGAAVLVGFDEARYQQLLTTAR